MGYRDTVQEAVISIMGEKKLATAVLQGKFSSDALCTDAGEDMKYRLLKVLTENIKLESADSIAQKLKTASVRRELTVDELRYLEMKNEAGGHNRPKKITRQVSIFEIGETDNSSTENVFKILTDNRNKKGKNRSGQILFDIFA
mgnify:CR=1 FL=1